jgi:hypothetical protein
MVAAIDNARIAIGVKDKGPRLRVADLASEFAKESIRIACELLRRNYTFYHAPLADQTMVATSKSMSISGNCDAEYETCILFPRI